MYICYVNINLKPKTIMKNILLTALMMVSGIAFAQNNPQLEAVDQKVEATYFYENGKVQQVGTFKDGKLDGKWISYSENGNFRSWYFRIS